MRLNLFLFFSLSSTLKFNCQASNCSEASLTLTSKDFIVIKPFNYSFALSMNDIAFINITNGINFDNFQPACLPLDDDVKYPNDFFLLTFDELNLANLVLKNMSWVSNDDCRNLLAYEDDKCPKVSRVISDYQMCAGQKLAEGKFSGTLQGL